MRIVVAPDKFRSTLSAPAAARAMAEGVARADHSIRCDICPLADGGEGSAEVMLRQLGGTRRDLTVVGPDGRPTDAWFALLPDGRAVVEMALASGLDLIERPAPLRASSIGTGELIAAAMGSAREVIVFVGGSASTDGGTGAARAMGWRFTDDDGHDLDPGGGSLARLAGVTRGRRFDEKVIGACDVPNPLLGLEGAARVFGPQKGASEREVEALEAGVERLAVVVREELGVQVAEIRHGGAGGGMGAGLVAFFGATLTSGFDLIAGAVGFDDLLDRADLVVTGEGRLDETSFRGKVVAGVLDRAGRAKTKCIAVVGSSSISSESALERGLHRVVTSGGADRGDPFEALVRATEAAVMAELAAM
ncbi:MAG: glycerate kinase [Actinomycetota bacterium]|nr:glycerate kinase [Actinomycetota bacterium]